MTTEQTPTRFTGGALMLTGASYSWAGYWLYAASQANGWDWLGPLVFLFIGSAILSALGLLVAAIALSVNPKRSFLAWTAFGMNLLTLTVLAIPFVFSA